MDQRMELRIVVGVCVILAGSFTSLPAQETAAEPAGFMSKRVRKVFARADDLATARDQRLRESLSSLSDEDLAQAYAQATAPQRVSLAEMKDLSAQAKAKVQTARPSVIEYLAKVSRPYDEKEYQAFRNQYGVLAGELASLGPGAAPILCIDMADAYRKTECWDLLAREAMVKMGPGAVEPLLSLMDSRDDQVRGRASDVLSRLGDPRVKDVLVRAMDDESGVVRAYALQGLIGLGPDVVGSRQLVEILVRHLDDRSCLHRAIWGLERYGDETAIEPLGVIERFHPGRGKGDLRYTARQAADAIHRRAGVPVEEIERADYPEGDGWPSYDELLATACCPNAALRCSAVIRLEQYCDDRTAMFLVRQLSEEEDRGALGQLMRSLGILVLSSQGVPETLSDAVVRQVFDSLVSTAEANSSGQIEGSDAAIEAARKAVDERLKLRPADETLKNQI